MSDEIEVHELRTLSVSSDGTAFRIGCKTAGAAECGLVFPSEALRTLMLSLFRVGDTAFKRLLDDPSARLVYPIASCRLETAPGGDHHVLILRSPDGFEAAFALPPDALTELAEVASDHAANPRSHRKQLN